MANNELIEDDWIVVGSPIGRVEHAEPSAGRTIRVTWMSGSEQVIDVTPALASHRAFIRLRTDDELFQTLRVGEDGDHVYWADGSELDAAWIEELGVELLDNAQFSAAMDSLRMSLDGMAARLGIARRLVASYRKDKPIPPTVALAIRYLLERAKSAG